jgi:hypothetical protein
MSGPAAPPRISRTGASTVLLVIGAVGVVVSVLAVVVGLRFLGHLDRALEDSVGVAAEAVDALGGTVEVAGESLTRITVILDGTATTTRDLSAAIADTEAVLRATADLSEDQIAGSLDAVDDALPALIQVAGVIDRTLSGLSVLPFGPDYGPDEPFDDSLRAIQREFDGLPDALREQAALIRDGSRDLRSVRVGTAVIADDLDALQATLADSAELVDRFAATATSARELVVEDQDGIQRQLGWARVLVVVLGVTFAAGQVLPLGVGWLLRRPEVAAAFLRVDGDREGP